MELTRFLISCFVLAVFKVLYTAGLPAVVVQSAPVDIPAPSISRSLMTTAQLSGMMPSMPEMPDMETAKAWLSNMISKGQSAYNSAKDKVVETYNTYSPDLPSLPSLPSLPAAMTTGDIAVPADAGTTVETVEIVAVQ